MLLESVRGLVSKGLNVVVTLPERGPLLSMIEESGASVEICPTTVLRKSYMNPVGLLRLGVDTISSSFSGIELMRRVRPDVVYVSTVTIPLWLVLARLHGLPVIAHVHEAERSVSAAVRWALALPLCLATSIISNSHYSTDVMTTAIPGLGRKIEILSNGVMGPADATIPREVQEGPLKLLYVGRLSNRKGVDVAIAAVAELSHRGREVQLSIVGAVYPGYEWYESELRTSVSAMGLTEQISFQGFHADIWPYYADTDIALVLSRIDEPFGNTAVEAVLAARPLVVTNTSGLREAAAGYKSALFVPTDDPQAVANAVELIAANWEEFREKAWKESKVAADRHSPVKYQDSIFNAVARVSNC